MALRDEFLETCKTNIQREGIESLLGWLEKSDFFIAPASTRFHGSYEGGLLTHSLNVYNRLLQLVDCFSQETSKETLTIVSLFHDVCKVNCYKTSMRNVKENNAWVQKPYYEFEEKFPFGAHGGKSMFLIERFMRLTEEEAVCIQTHMGSYDRNPGDFTLNKAFERYPLALLLHTADNYATCVDEKLK